MYIVTMVYASAFPSIADAAQFHCCTLVKCSPPCYTSDVSAAMWCIATITVHLA